MTMHRKLLNLSILSLITALLHTGAATAQEKSGPQPGEFLPGSFAPFNLNGPSKGLYHSLVCEYGLHPVVAVFVRERRDGKDEGVRELLQKLDEMLPRFQADGLHAFAVILSPDAQSSVFQEKTEGVDKVLQEEELREKLRARLEPVATGFKGLVVSTYPAQGPAGYNLNPKAEVTVVVYDRLKVRANWAFREGQLTSRGIQQVITGVEKVLQTRKN
jgi:hypothetical protein